MTTPLATARLVALCRPAAPICPRCGRVLVGSPVTVPHATVVRCRNQTPHGPHGGARRADCGQHVAVVPGPGSTTLVLALSPAEARTLVLGQPLDLPTSEIALCHAGL